MKKVAIILSAISIMVMSSGMEILAQGANKVFNNGDRIYKEIRDENIKLGSKIMLRGDVGIIKERDKSFSFNTLENGGKGYYTIKFDGDLENIDSWNKIIIEGEYIGNDMFNFPIIKAVSIKKL